MKYTVEENIKDFVVDEQQSYKIVLSSLDYEKGMLKFVLCNNLADTISFRKGKITYGDNVVLAKMDHDPLKVEETIVCSPREITNIDVEVEKIREKENFALIFSFAIKLTGSEYYRYDLSLAVDFDFDSIDLGTERMLGADMEEMPAASDNFNIDQMQFATLDQKIDSMVRTVKDKSALLKALEIRNGGEEYNLEKLGLFYKNIKDDNNYLYNMKQLVAMNNRVGFAELAEYYIKPRKSQEERSEGYKYACKLEKMNDPVGTFWKGYARINGIGVYRSIPKGADSLQQFIDSPGDNDEKVKEAKRILSSAYTDHYPYDLDKLNIAQRYIEDLNLESTNVKKLINAVNKKKKERKWKTVFVMVLLLLLFTVGKYFNNNMPVIRFDSSTTFGPTTSTEDEDMNSDDGSSQESYDE
ncbi:hypothetical protein [Butyrivibrio sp. YAB3001]|uniref:hypothetical protein n=1 Tax=Butyrivibrio sp. YAB3001 TaxID=1520812 RepID=UPI0008F65E6C|nr:hypothetical protein [Butyrivibrio sp. YAB3001]SFB81567.1 hypothetical protein SAMN02910398_00719 [Butyrivibrio sp. YAB3001]